MRFLRLCFVIFVLRRFFRLPIVLLVVVWLVSGCWRLFRVGGELKNDFREWVFDDTFGP